MPLKYLTAAVICWLVAVAGSAAEPSASLQSLDRHFAEQLKALAEKCNSLQLAEQAKITQSWQVQRRSGCHQLFIPPTSDVAKPSSTAPELVKRWHAKFLELRVAHANALYEIAQEFLAAGDGARAYQLLHEVLRENPDHEAARRVLGYVRIGIGADWSPYSPPPVASFGRTPHPKTGWQQEKYWRVESKHWRIATNHGAAAGIELAKKLEDLHCLWKQIFFDYWCSTAELQAAMQRGVALPDSKPPMNVLLFAVRGQYLKFFEPTRPYIAKTNGLYADDQRTAVFYFGDASVQPTWYHEATHQLFQEWRGAPEGVGGRHNFWLVEGAALYVESLQNQGNHWTAGGWQADRLQIPRYRELSGEKGLPWAELVTLGRDDVQQHAEIGKLYSQFAAKTHFLLDNTQPAYRRATSLLLREIYDQADKPESLARLTSASYSELDEQARQAWQVTDEDLLTTPGLASLRNLSVGRTKVTSRGLAALSNCKELRWVDLCGLPVTDDGLAQIKSSSKLSQLFLDDTQITADSLPLIASFSELEELDLSNLTVDETNLPSLGRLRKLKLLYLTGTRVSPGTLARLKQVLPRTTIEP